MEEGNEGTCSLEYCRFLYLEAGSGTHQPVHQFIASVLLHSCSKCGCFCASLG